jgi:hypothetical protein
MSLPAAGHKTDTVTETTPSPCLSVSVSYATAFLSSAVSWPLSITAGLWTQLWGFTYGEFKDSPRRVYITLFTGIALYLLGAYTIASL